MKLKGVGGMTAAWMYAWIQVWAMYVGEAIRTEGGTLLILVQ